MEIKQPLCITSRLLPGVRIGKATISIEYAEPTLGRQYYRWFIDLDGQEFTGNELASGAGGGTLQEGLESLLCFLGAFAEACSNDYPDCGLESENTNLFPRGLAFWAVENQDAISTLECKLQEHPGELIIE